MRDTKTPSAENAELKQMISLFSFYGGGQLSGLELWMEPSGALTFVFKGRK